MTISNVLSGSVAGRGVKITTTANPGDLLHTVPAGGDSGYSIWLYAINNDTMDRTLTVQFGGTTSPDDLITATVKAGGGLQFVVPGLLLGVGLSMRAFASVANQIVVFGFIRAHSEL